MEQVRDRLRLKHYSSRTEKTYLYWIRRFIFATGIECSYPTIQTPNGKVTYTGLKTTRHRFNLGAAFYTTGIPTLFPPVITPPLEIETTVPLPGNVNGPVYPSYAPATDSDGNDIAGVRLADQRGAHRSV